MDFGEKLKALRTERGLTQEQLAAKLYVSRTAVSKWETGGGSPNLDSLQVVARLFDVSVDDLQPGVANRLNEGIRVDDMEAADALVKEYEDEIAARSKNQAEGGNAESGRNADAKDASDAKNGGAA